MNERIRELLHQCSVPNDQAENYSKSKGLVIPDQKLDVAKFAELIVRECMESLWTEECHTSDLAAEDYNRNCRKIKQHFGIGEVE